MKTILPILALAVLLMPVYGKPGKDFPSGAEIPGMKYIADAKAFLPAESYKLTPAQRKALRFSKNVLGLYLEAEIKGVFSIAEADWGFQVQFTQIEIKRNGKWEAAVEGFGEVFLDKDLSRIQIDYGP
jgi:hypothetical protein